MRSCTTAMPTVKPIRAHAARIRTSYVCTELCTRIRFLLAELWLISFTSTRVSLPGGNRADTSRIACGKCRIVNLIDAIVQYIYP